MRLPDAAAARVIQGGGMKYRSVIRGTGSYLPTRKVCNQCFLESEFYDSTGVRFERPTAEIIQKFEQITGISERRYVTDEFVTSDIAHLAAEDALKSSGVDPESLDYIIVAHNFGDVRADCVRSEFVPTLAARVKHKLRIRKPDAVAYDLPFGCPGWLEGVIHAHRFLESGEAKRALVIGAETLSRVSDPHDRDSMIYADGAGATVIESEPHDEPVGILSHCSRSDTLEHANLLRMAPSYNPQFGADTLFLKMDGHKLYEYALRHVPALVKKCIDKAGLVLGDIKKLLLHQANAKMDDAIAKRLFRLCDAGTFREEVMPMTISWLGNSSVATLPTLLDLLMKGQLGDHELVSGDAVVFASVGAGMNINAMAYRLP